MGPAGVALAALYAAAQLASFDSGLVEDLFGTGLDLGVRCVLRRASIAATALLPAAVLAAGLRLRSRFLLAAGVVRSRGLADHAPRLRPR